MCRYLTTKELIYDQMNIRAIVCQYENMLQTLEYSPNIFCFKFQALDILRRTHMMPLKSDISITYIPASDAAVFKATAITRLGTASQPEQVRPHS